MGDGAGGKLNGSYNCLDRHAAADPDRVAFLWEGDEIGTTRRLTYAEALQHTCRIANVLLAHGVRSRVWRGGRAAATASSSSSVCALPPTRLSLSLSHPPLSFLPHPPFLLRVCVAATCR